MVVRWPGRVAAGSTQNQTVCLNDFMATVADLLDVPLSDDTAEDSVSILPLLTGDAAALPDRPMVVNHDIGGRFAIRNGKWKLVGGRQLFDLDADPKESRNQAAAFPEVVKDMQAALTEIRTSGRSRPSP